MSEEVQNNTAAITSLNVAVANLTSRVDGVTVKIPNAASKDNRLADKAWVQTRYDSDIKDLKDNKIALDGGVIPSSYLPGYVDDVVEHGSKLLFPAKGESGKLYVDISTKLVYRWSGSDYVEISPSLALGETSATAFPGNRGKALEDRLTGVTQSVSRLSETLEEQTARLADKQDKLTDEQVAVLGSGVTADGFQKKRDKTDLTVYDVAFSDWTFVESIETGADWEVEHVTPDQGAGSDEWWLNSRAWGSPAIAYLPYDAMADKLVFNIMGELLGFDEDVVVTCTREKTAIHTSDKILTSADVVPMSSGNAGQAADAADTYRNYTELRNDLQSAYETASGAFSVADEARNLAQAAIPKYEFSSHSSSADMLISLVPYTNMEYFLTPAVKNVGVRFADSSTGTVRNCTLVLRCAGDTAPDVSWPSDFLPCTDAATDFKCEVGGVRNVYFITEYSPDKFRVERWLET